MEKSSIRVFKLSVEWFQRWLSNYPASKLLYPVAHGYCLSYLQWLSSFMDFICQCVLSSKQHRFVSLNNVIWRWLGGMVVDLTAARRISFQVSWVLSPLKASWLNNFFLPATVEQPHPKIYSNCWIKILTIASWPPPNHWCYHQEKNTHQIIPFPCHLLFSLLLLSLWGL